jgi:hypothetical protein
MSRFLKGLAVVLAFLVVTVCGVTVYHFATTSTFKLVAVYMDDETPAVFRWSAKQSLYWFHPDEADVKQLNREAGAQYVVDVLGPEEARPVLRHLMDNGLDINSMSEVHDTTFTALHAAAITNNAEGAQLLLELGADPTLKDSEGRTALELARYTSNRPNRVEDYSTVIDVLEKAQR